MIAAMIGGMIAGAGLAVMIVALAIVAVAIVALLAFVWMAGGVQSARTFEEEPVYVGEVPTAIPPDVQQIRIVVWNIAWGYGWGSEGNGRARPAEHFRSSVQRIGDLLAQLGADLALLQEVDFDSTRSGRTDQALAIAQRASLPFVARATSWTARWIPFPYWPPREHFGFMRSGGAILSRFPIIKNTTTLLDKPDEYPIYYRLFYLFRYLQHAEVAIGGKRVHVFNTHLEAFKEKNRIEQARRLRGLLGPQPWLIFGGDLNAVPPEATLKHDYPDEAELAVKTSHDTDETVTIVRAIRGLTDAFPAETYSRAEQEFFTFPAHAPNRKLDHLFLGEGFEVENARVAREAGEVSDHLPLVITLRRRSDPGGAP